MQGSAILFSEMTPQPAWEPEFNDWYDHEHIPLRMAVDGFVSAQRYKSLQDGSYLAVYEMRALSVLQSEAYGRVKNQPSDMTRRMLKDVSGFTRYLCEEIGEQRAAHADASGASAAIDGACLYPVFFQVPEERVQAFDDWYEQDHVPLLLDCPDWLSCRRFRIRDGDPGRWTHLALHYLRDPRALDSPERERARATPWRARLAAEPWFKPHYLLFARHGGRQIAAAAT